MVKKKKKKLIKIADASFKIRVFSEIDHTNRKLGFTFSRAVLGDIVKMLFPSISNTVNKCLPKKVNFVNIVTPCRKKAKACENTFTKTVA